MSVKRFPADVSAAELRALSPPPPVEAVGEIVDAVRSGGANAVLDYERRFGAGGATSIAPIGREVLTAALDALDPALRSALELAIVNVETVAKRQLADDTSVTLAQGHTVATRGVPVHAAAAYVPGGRGSYPSTAIMCLVPARVAGVKRICAASPVRGDGIVDPSVQAVCAILEVSELYPIGGAQAVAALALGCDGVEPVDVIVGPGNAYVQEAKRQVFGTVGIDGIAGPSELVVVADAGADARELALDFRAQAEHGPDSLLILIADEPDLLDAVAQAAGGLDADLALVLAADLDSAIALADDIAPEHLQIACSDSICAVLASRVTRAGCMFVGYNGATAFGDYVAGSNHVLPTGGAARYASPLSPNTFRRRMSQVEIADSSLTELAQAGATIAGAEGFPDHGRSMTVRADRAPSASDTGEGATNRE